MTDIPDTVATWPETVACIAVRLLPDGQIDVCAPYGLTDLLTGVWRRNPRRIDITLSRQRLDRLNPQQRWPGVRIVPL